jgi:hypothetical protein
VTTPDVARCTPGRCRHPGAGLCDPCGDQLVGWLTDLPTLWNRLHANLSSSRAAPFVGVTRHSGGTWSTPIRVPVHDHIAAARTVLTTWATRIAEQRRLTHPTPPALAFHRIHATWSASRPWATQYATDVHAVWRPAMSLTQSWPAPPDHAPGVPCTRCDRMTLYRTPGADGWRCGTEGCWHWISDRTYEQVVAARAAVARQSA